MFTCKIPSPCNPFFKINNPPINRSRTHVYAKYIRGSAPPSFGSCWLINFDIASDKWVALVLDPHLRRKCTKSKKGLVIGMVNSHGLTWAKWKSTIIIFHKRRQSLTVLLFFCLVTQLIQLVDFGPTSKLGSSGT